MLCPLYMAEISPPEFRGSLMAMEQFSIVLGCVLGFWAGFFTRGGMSFSFPLICCRQIVRYDDLSHVLLTYPTPTQYITNARFVTTTLHGDRPFFWVSVLFRILRGVLTVFRGSVLCGFSIAIRFLFRGQSKDLLRGGFRSVPN